METEENSEEVSKPIPLVEANSGSDSMADSDSEPLSDPMLNHLKRCKKFHEVDDDECGHTWMEQTASHYRMQRKAYYEIEDEPPFDQDACQRALVRMIIIDELPFGFVEGEGFREYMSELQPLFTIPSPITVIRDCVVLYMEEKQKLRRFFQNYSGSVCITTDTWTSDRGLQYISLTAHFIDDDWVLHKKILNFWQITSHSGDMIAKAVEICLLSWGIKKVFAVTVDNASPNDVGMRHLRDRVKVWGESYLDGEFLHMRSGSHILNLVVKDCLEGISDSVSRIRAAVHYIKSSPQRWKRFKTCMEQQKLPTNISLHFDCGTRWNSTYRMLESALKVKKAFDLLELQDEEYRNELTESGIGLPSENDWSCIRGSLPALVHFYKTTVKISGWPVTGNLYMRKIFGVGVSTSLVSTKTNDELEQLIAKKMREMFHKHWGDYRSMNVMVYLATVLDPRFKMQWVSWAINQVYEEEKAVELIGTIKNTLERMFEYYKTFSASKNGSSSQMGEGNGSNVDKVDVRDWMDIADERYLASQEPRTAGSELERYLKDDCEDEDGNETETFDILCWWSTRGSKYKTLSLMAKDLLAIPVSNVPPERAFSTEDRILGPFHSSLTPKILEALICTRDWIREHVESCTIEETVEDFEIFELG